MRLKISTKVEQGYLQVKEGFTEDLFKALNPPFPPVKLEKFDGCKKGDQVVLELNFILFKQRWVSDIIDHKTDDQKFEFIDEGVALPFFLKSWRHHHLVIKNGDNTSQIVDDITFKSPFILFDLLLYPALYFQFLYRKPVYKRLFKNK